MKRGYVCAEEFWLFVDQYMRNLDVQSEQAAHWKSESYKLILAGRMEAMHEVMDFLKENEIAVERMKELFDDWAAGHGQ